MHSHYSGLEHLTLKHISKYWICNFMFPYIYTNLTQWLKCETKIKSKTSRFSWEKPSYSKQVIFIVLGSVSVLMCKFKAKQISFFENSSHLNANIHRSLFMPSESTFIFCAIFCECARLFSVAYRHNEGGWIWSNTLAGLNFAKDQIWPRNLVSATHALANHCS